MFLKELFLYLSAFFAPRLFVCDKIGAMRYYQKVFRDLFGFSLEVIEEGPLYSKYRWRNGLALEFYRAADRTFLPVAISSMIGKYIREIWMQRVNSFFISKFQDLEPVSGYPNLRTYCFIKRTEVFLKKGKIHKDCFLRIC
jgi:ribonuclease HII